MSHDEWLAWRRQGIGASDLPGIMGTSPWATPLSVWASKVWENDDDETEAMRWGHLLESSIAAEFAVRTGLHVLGEQTMVEWPDNPIHRATIDGWVGESPEATLGSVLGVLEIKTSSVAVWDVVPDHVRQQVQWQLHVTGKVRAWVAALFGGRSLRIYQLTRDDEEISRLVEAADNFWTNHVLTGEAPPAAGSDLDLLGDLFPGAPGSEIELTDTDMELLDQLVGWQAQQKALQTLIDDAKARLEQAMADAETATFGGDPVLRWTIVESERLDTKGLRAAMPEVAAQFTTTSRSRRFSPVRRTS